MSFRLFVLTAVAGAMLATPAPTFADPRVSHQHDAVVTSDETPVRQGAVVWFTRPVLIGRTILLGRYIIEHDTHRQARGEPCTHIYAANNRRAPVVAFHCRHLNRPAAPRGTVTVYSTTDPAGFMKIEEFQFAGEAAAHGVPGR